MKSLLLILAVTGCVSSPAFAQPVAFDKDVHAFPTAGERKAAAVASWATLGTSMAIDFTMSFRKGCDTADECYNTVLKTAIRNTVTMGAVLVLKRVVDRGRPCAPSACGPDNPRYSFPSGHTTFAFSTLGGWHTGVMLPLAIGTGGLRVAGGKHWATDAIAGAGIGLLTSRIR